MKDIKDYIKVDPTSPSGLRWIKKASARGMPGSPAGWKTKFGYWRLRFDGSFYQCHRLVLELTEGKADDENKEPDHINGDGTDNRVENLRWVTKSRNMMNIERKNQCNLRWVTSLPNRSKPYFYQMRMKGKKITGPYFATAEEAHAAALAKRKELGLPIDTRLSTVKP